MINEKGKAAIINAFCNACNPPLYNKIAAIAASITPHVSFTLFGGVSEPFVVCIPKTNVAESAEVIKNITTSKTAIKDNILDIGSWLNISNNTSSVANCVKSTFPACCTSIAVVPDTANQRKLTKVGKSITPIRNSRIVLPLDTRAMKIPTNGDHEIHQAQ